MNKKTIFYVGGFELPNKNAAAQRVLSVAKIFRELGYNVVFLGISKELDNTISIEKTKEEYYGFESWAIPYPKNKEEWINHISSANEVKFLIDKYYKEKLFAIIPYNHPFISQYKIKNICKLNNAYYIPDATEWYSSKGKGLIFGLIKWLDTSLRMRYIHTEADGIIATSDYLANYYKKKNMKVLELPSMFDSYELDNIKEKRIEKKKDTKYLMYAGSAYDENNPQSARKNSKDRLDKIIELLYKMHKLNSSFIFNIFGLEKHNYLMAFPEHYDLLNDMSKKVFFHGKKDHSEILSYIKFSDFTIFLRDIDRVTLAGFPTKFSESLCCGTPVLTNKISNVEKYLIKSENGFFIDIDNVQNQIQLFNQIFALNESEIFNMKQSCRKIRNLDYRNFISMTEDFFTLLKEK